MRSWGILPQRVGYGRDIHVTLGRDCQATFLRRNQPSAAGWATEEWPWIHAHPYNRDRQRGRHHALARRNRASSEARRSCRAARAAPSTANRSTDAMNPSDAATVAALLACHVPKQHQELADEVPQPRQPQRRQREEHPHAAHSRRAAHSPPMRPMSRVCSRSSTCPTRMNRPPCSRRARGSRSPRPAAPCGSTRTRPAARNPCG